MRSRLRRGPIERIRPRANRAATALEAHQLEAWQGVGGLLKLAVSGPQRQQDPIHVQARGGSEALAYFAQCVVQRRCGVQDVAMMLPGARRRPSAPHGLAGFIERPFRGDQHRVVGRGALGAAGGQHQQTGELRGNQSQILEVRTHFEDVTSCVIVEGHGTLLRFFGSGFVG
jgi:hypothetical protein